MAWPLRPLRVRAAFWGVRQGAGAHAAAILVDRDVADVVEFVVSSPEGLHLQPLTDRRGSLSG